MEEQSGNLRPVIGASQLVDPVKEEPELLAPDDWESHRMLQLADVALRHVKENRANVRTHTVQQRRRVWPGVHKNGNLRPLCYDHHIEMEFSHIPRNAGRLTHMPCYLCPEPGCSVAYGRREGYFMIIPRREYTERDIMPCVSCPRDGQLMFLAQIKPERRSFRLWRCPRCKTSRTNEEVSRPR